MKKYPSERRKHWLLILPSWRPAAQTGNTMWHCNRTNTTKDKSGGGALTHKPSAHADNNDNNSPIQKKQQPPSGPHSGPGQPISGTVLKVAKAYFVDFLHLLPRLKVKPNTCGHVISGSDHWKASVTQDVTTESFDLWLQEWSIYQEMIQKTNRKFVWSAVYNYDVQFYLTLTLNTSACFDTVDTTLHMTIIDASAIRKEGISCQHCELQDHLTRNCLCCAKTATGENQGWKRLSLRPHPDLSQQTYAWKYKKWFTSNGKEGCNLFQHISCQQGTECKCTYVFRLAGGTTLWTIANRLPDVNSPFNIQ